MARFPASACLKGFSDSNVLQPLRSQNGREGLLLPAIQVLGVAPNDGGHGFGSASSTFPLGCQRWLGTPSATQRTKRGQIIQLLEQALALADELGDGNTGFLIERALYEARSHPFQAGRALGLTCPGRC